LAEKLAIIIGAGPAGLTAAYELLDKTDIKPIIYESGELPGGLAKTVNYKGNRIDIGGHRFFSKSDRVMDWWLNILPLQRQNIEGDSTVEISYRNSSRTIAAISEGSDPEETDRVMLVRNRLSRIFYGRKFYDYPISLNATTIRNLGVWRVIRIGLSYLKVRFFPIRPEQSLEDFFINRFGLELYHTFFKDYTRKVWGVPCNQIKPEWGAQRVKGLSLRGALFQAIKNAVSRDGSIRQKDVETSLIQRFLYPKYGPGQMWEEVARIVADRGGEIHYRHRVVGLTRDAERIVQIEVRNDLTGETTNQPADHVFSTMPIKDLIECFGDGVPPEVAEVARGLVYRDFITVGILLKKLKIAGEQRTVQDNWIYVQEPDVRVGRLQVFNNWSPYMVSDPRHIWIGCEYFCNVGDDLWSKSDGEIAQFAIEELDRIGFIDTKDVLDSVVLREPKTYPAYFGSYDSLDTVREFVNRFENLFLIGRNGMHHYNNQDHSMLTAMIAVENIANGVKTKDNIWSVNTEDEYHESK